MLYTFFDVETSGLVAGSDVLSFSYILADENLNVKRAETLYFWKEGVTHWTEEAYEINKLSKEFLRKHADKYEDNLKKMYIVMSCADLVGYNSGYVDSDGIIKGFDYSMCKSFLQRNDIDPPKIGRLHDVMRIAMRSGYGRVKLQTLFDKLGLSRDIAAYYSKNLFGEEAVAHSASYDTICTAMIFQYMVHKGIIDNSVGTPDYTEEVEPAKESQYIVYFGENNVMIVRDETDGSETPLTTLMKENPVLGKQITSNIYAYMRMEG